MCEVGACVVGRWEGGWYRGRVLSVSREGGRVEVQFVDYGNVAMLAKNDLSLVLDKHMEKPEQAIRCHEGQDWNFQRPWRTSRIF